MPLPFGDNPVSNPSEDLLGRNDLAGVLASEISEMDASEGAVVAITGPWGSGKTSLMNLVATQLRCDESILGVVEFNPWLYSGAEQLAESLLSEIAAKLRDQESGPHAMRRLASDVTEKLAIYSAGLGFLRAVPIVGTFVQGAKSGLEDTTRALRGDQSLQQRRQKAIEALQTLERRVVVLVDDIDRLTKGEIRDLFRTVRLSASFPNVVYLLCLDHRVVGSALDEPGFSGIAYLEKILTVTCRVPELADHQIASLFTDGLNDLISVHDTGPDNEETWAEAYPQIIRPLFKTLRDPKRVLAALPISFRLLGAELPVIDVVALECVRVLYPSLYSAIENQAEALTSPPRGLGVWSGPRIDERLASGVKEFVESDENYGGRIATALVQIFFRHAIGRLPGDSSRYSSPGEPPVGSIGWFNGLNYYLTHQETPGTATASSVRRIIAAFGDLQDLVTAFNSIHDDRLEDALSRIVDASQAILPEQVPASVEVLLRLFPRLREGTTGFPDFGARFAITRPVLRMLQRLEPEQVLSLSERLVTETPTAYGAFELVTLVGHRQNAGHRLVSEEQAKTLEERLRVRIQNAGDSLATERDLLPMLYHLGQRAPDELAFTNVQSRPVVAAILRSAIATSRRHVLGDSTVTVSYALYWEILKDVLGGEEKVREAAIFVRQVTPDDEPTERALQLIDDYLAGWRPEDPFESPGSQQDEVDDQTGDDRERPSGGDH